MPDEFPWMSIYQHFNENRAPEAMTGVSATAPAGLSDRIKTWPDSPTHPKPKIEKGNRRKPYRSKKISDRNGISLSPPSDARLQPLWKRTNLGTYCIGCLDRWGQEPTGIAPDCSPWFVRSPFPRCYFPVWLPSAGSTARVVAQKPEGS